jgi:molecular chaperone HtpG
MRKFKTESKKLLDLMVNSIYTNQEIFLRELISNASDAVDKLNFRSLTDPSIKTSKDDLAILVAFDADARTITVSDNGIGMTPEELEKNLGTIAHSGSQEFKTENADDQGDRVDIIGQFGVGFYSSFMVAKNVVVISRVYGAEEASRWESDGIEGYSISPAERESHGTTITLTLKDDTDESDYRTYLSEQGIKNLVKRYSNYVRYPVKMLCKHSRALPKPEDAGDDYKTTYEEYTSLDTINSMVPIWKQRKSEVGQEAYDEFYKSTFHDFGKPLRTFSIHAEGALSYDALLFIPARVPYDLYSRDFKKGLALYSSNVMIMEKCEELLPDCFNFVCGIVDSQDLSLNISRETLQHNSQLRAIARKIEKRVKSELVDLRDTDREAYETFFDNFGASIKYGLYTSYGAQKDLLIDLLMFYSAREKKMVTLDEYVAACSSTQDAIFYAAGESFERLAKMPVVEGVLDRGYDVLFCTQEVDEFAFMALQGYDEKVFKNVAGGDLGLETEEEKKDSEAAQQENADLFAAMEEALDGRVSKVTVSARLTDSPVCLTAEGPVSLEMEKVLSGMPNIGEAGKSERVLEINAKHPVFETLRQAQAAGDAEKVARYTNILYNQALLVEGLKIDDPVAYAQQICELLS